MANPFDIDPAMGSFYVNDFIKDSLDLLLDDDHISSGSSDHEISPHSHPPTSTTSNQNAYCGTGLNLPPLMNAVQMEVQENAKVPNLYNVPVRRTNPTTNPSAMTSSTKNRTLPRKQQLEENNKHDNKMIAKIATAMTDNKVLVDEILRLTEADVALTENFLGNDQRTSKAAAYSNAGALMSSIGTKVDNISTFMNEALNNKTASSQMNNTAYGRTVPLPIPTKRKSPNRNNNTANNGIHHNHHQRRISTAPSITPSTTVIQQTHHQNQQPIMKNPHVNNKQHASISIHPQKQQSHTTPIDIHLPLSSSLSSPIYAPAPSPSLLDATKKRSQFGFGNNHTVPSVPLPPPTYKLIKKKTITTTIVPRSIKTAMATASSVARKRKNVIPIRTTITSTPLPPPITASASNEGASYERKKQRAKEARVKLNESIERLSVAINLAGAQSKQRAKAHEYWSNNGDVHHDINSSNTDDIQSSPTPSTNPTSTTTSSNTTTNGIKETTTIMEDAGITADTAKKWERPSFVGSAATMIQNLNSQCEALMRELVHVKKMQNDGVCACGKKLSTKLGSKVKREHGCTGDNILNISGQSMKRIKVAHEDLKIDINTIIKRDKLISRIGSFLDPQSILRFACVSKSWQIQLDPIMKSDAIWSPLCVKRFGALRVREWLNEEEEDDNNVLCVQDSNGNAIISHMKLYFTMNELNVKRKCHFEGNLPLGEGRISNIACAWISAVERSNGETLRSVLALSGGGEVKYVSQPIVELRILIQNIGVADTCIFVPDQIIAVDASTKRRGDEMFEITSDQRLSKKIYKDDGSVISSVHNPGQVNHTVNNLIHLNLYESSVFSVFIHAKACSTTAKFRNRANFVKILVSVRGTTLPLVIPITNAKKK